eukprot:7881252-Pyramimonas_sp.AAC.1
MGVFPHGPQSSGCPVTRAMTRRTRQDRRRERARLGRLRDRIVTPRTLEKYKAATRSFFAFCTHQ